MAVLTKDNKMSQQQLYNPRTLVWDKYMVQRKKLQFWSVQVYKARNCWAQSLVQLLANLSLLLLNSGRKVNQATLTLLYKPKRPMFRLLLSLLQVNLGTTRLVQVVVHKLDFQESLSYWAFNKYFWQQRNWDGQQSSFHSFSFRIVADMGLHSALL